jgi:flagellar basal-body rod protein FlgG
MLRASQVALARLYNHQDRIEAISHNVSNVNTVGYRAIDSKFQGNLERAIASSGQEAEGALSWPRVFTEGNLAQTGVWSDLAVSGNGFFAVTDAEGKTLYTRDGRLAVDGMGRLVTSTGGRVDLDWVGNPVDFSGRTLTVSRKGLVYINDATNGEVGKDPVAKLRVVTFERPENLWSESGLNFRETTRSGPPRQAEPDGRSLSVVQGALEASNVDYLTEMTELLMAQRLFQMTLRAVQQTGSMLELANNIRR